MIKNIFFDFDGVILDSMSVRDMGFREILSRYDSNFYMEDFIKYHRINGGLSRFHKIKYFFQKYLNSEISEDNISFLAEKFSEIMKKELIKDDYLIKDTIKFIEINKNKYNMYIVSGSEEKELNYLCLKLRIGHYFNYIKGSPTHKDILIKNIIETDNLNREECILIGDSINDYEAAKINNIDFYGFNNKALIEKSKKYIKSFENFIF